MRRSVLAKSVRRLQKKSTRFKGIFKSYLSTSESQPLVTAISSILNYNFHAISRTASILPRDSKHRIPIHSRRKDFQGRGRRRIRRHVLIFGFVWSLPQGRRERDSQHGGGLYKFEGCNWRPNTFTIQIMEIPRVYVLAVVVPGGACTLSMSGFIPRNQTPPPFNPLFSFERVTFTSTYPIYPLSLSLSSSLCLPFTLCPFHPFTLLFTRPPMDKKIENNIIPSKTTRRQWWSTIKGYHDLVSILIL